MTLLPRSMCEGREAHEVLHRFFDYELENRRNESMRMWTEDHVDLGSWGILGINARVVTLRRE